MIRSTFGFLTVESDCVGVVVDDDDDDDDEGGGAGAMGVEGICGRPAAAIIVVIKCCCIMNIIIDAAIGLNNVEFGPGKT